MNEIRLRPVTVTLTPEEAGRERDETLEHLHARLEALKQEIWELAWSPLPTTATRYVEVRPGEPGYDEASHGIRMIDDGGRWQFATEDLGKAP